MGFTMVQYGFKSTIGLLGKLQIAISKPTFGQLFTIGRLMKGDVISHFNQRGPGWAKHAPATIKRWGRKKLMITTTDLQFEHRITQGARSVYLSPEAKVKRYAMAQNLGDAHKPPRTFYYLSENAQRKISLVAMTDIDKLLRTAK